MLFHALLCPENFLPCLSSVGTSCSFFRCRLKIHSFTEVSLAVFGFSRETNQRREYGSVTPVLVPVPRSKGWRNQVLMSEAGGEACPSSGRERAVAFPLPFCSVRGLGLLGGARPRWGSVLPTWSSHALASLLWKHLTDAPRHDVFPAPRASPNPGKLTLKVDCHTS